ncbi:dual specificity tyrosine-phosphorylation-regulated kinase 2-like [Diadema antillarum]|uniref:dual specificity tyrosine-phosphorylation-regulated kinase 2-like n=1 Tax=Diadema antillarum TaxID=105358 RepID=UPI003A8A89B5
MAAKSDFFCEHISAFSQSIRRSSSPQAWQAPPRKHCISRVTGGLEEIYTKIQSGWQNVEEEDYSKCISSDGFFQPHSKVGLLAGRYQVVRVLGRGNSSTIVQAHDTFRPGHFEVAIKILKPEYFALGYQESHLILELNKADSHNICGIVKLLNTFKLGPFFCMTFELMQPWPLHHVFKKITDGKEKLAMIRKVAVRMLQILGFLGHQNVIHADLKPENILCPSGKHKISALPFNLQMILRQLKNRTCARLINRS